METLAIIAYRQPISKTEVEHIRGVSCDYAIQKLLEKELIEISGKSDGPGRPILYSASHTFMDYFGIRTVKDLPQLKDLHMEQNEIGLPSEESLSENMEPSFSEEIPLLEAPIESEDFVTEMVDGKDDENYSFEIDLEEKKVTADLLDRKAIYIENELKNLAEEESTDSEDLDNQS